MTARARALDVRLAVPAATAWIGAAAVQVAPVRASAYVGVSAAVVAIVALGARRVVLAAAALGLAAGVTVMSIHVAALHRGPVADAASSRRTADLVLRLVRDPTTVMASTGRRISVVDATAVSLRADSTAAWQPSGAPVVVFGITGWGGLLPGQRVLTRGRLLPTRPGDTVSAVVFVSGPPRRLGRPPVWQRAAGHVRDRLRDAVAALPPDERGLVPGLVIGDVSAMPPDLTAAFRVTGLTHLNAVSGANVAIVLGAVLAAVRRVGAGRTGRAALAGAALLAFVVLVRPSPSVLRAAVMGAVVLIASVVGRRSATVPVLSAAVLLLVLTDPFLARTPGFALSVLATAAIVVLAPPVTERLAHSMPRPLAGAVAVPLVAQLACTPVLVAVFGQLTPWAVPANLLAAPAVPPATLLGIGCALTGVVWPAGAALIARPAALPAWWLATVARTLAALPGAGLRWPTGVGGLALLAVTVVAGFGLRQRLRRARRRAMLDVCPR